MTKSFEHKSNLLQMIPVNGHRISQQSKWPVSLKLAFFFNAQLFAGLFCLSLLLAMPGLNFGLWDLVPWSRIKLRPPALGTQSPLPWTKFPLKLGSWVKFSCWQDSLTQQITEVLLNCCACSGIPRLQHSFWKLTELSTTWKPKPDMIPISNCFQLTEEQVKKKKFLCLVCSPTSLDPEMWNEGSDQK